MLQICFTAIKKKKTSPRHRLGRRFTPVSIERQLHAPASLLTLKWQLLRSHFHFTLRAH